MKQAILASIVLVSLLVQSAFLVQSVASSCTVISHKGFLTTEGFRVVGEVENSGSQSITNVTLEFKFYDSNDQTIQTLEFPTDLDVIPPGRKSPISIYLSNQTEASRVKTFEVNVVSYQECPEKPAELNMTWTAFDNVSILGGIRNYAYKGTQFAIVFATFYDENRSVVDVSASDYIMNFSATSDEQFEMYLPIDEDVFKSPTWYSLTAESTDYSVMAETSLVRLVLSSPHENSPIDFFWLGALVGIPVIAVLGAFLVTRRKRKKSPQKRRP